MQPQGPRGGSQVAVLPIALEGVLLTLLLSVLLCPCGSLFFFVFLSFPPSLPQKQVSFLSRLRVMKHFWFFGAPLGSQDKGGLSARHLARTSWEGEIKFFEQTGSYHLSISEVSLPDMLLSGEVLFSYLTLLFFLGCVSSCPSFGCVSSCPSFMSATSSSFVACVFVHMYLYLCPPPVA